MITITTRDDLVTAVRAVRFDLEAHGLTLPVVDRLQALDHPAWGTDWEGWLDVTLTDATVEDVALDEVRRVRIVRSAAIGGLPIEIDDVARIDKRRGVITMRDTYADDDDGRVLSAVQRCAREAAEELARASGSDVEVYAAEGHLWMTVEASR